MPKKKNVLKFMSEIFFSFTRPSNPHSYIQIIIIPHVIYKARPRPSPFIPIATCAPFELENPTYRDLSAMWQICLNVTIKVGESRQYGRSSQIIIYYLTSVPHVVLPLSLIGRAGHFGEFFFCLSVACEPQPRGRQFRRRRFQSYAPHPAPPHRLPNFPSHPIHYDSFSLSTLSRQGLDTLLAQRLEITTTPLCKSSYSHHYHRLSLPFFTSFLFP